MTERPSKNREPMLLEIEVSRDSYERIRPTPFIVTPTNTKPKSMVKRWWDKIKPRDEMAWVIAGYGLVHVFLGPIAWIWAGRVDLGLCLPLMGAAILFMGYFMDRRT